MKRVSFKVAKAIKEAGYPQWSVEETDNSKLAYDCEGELWEIRYFDQNPQDYYTAPTYLDVWLWLWREKKIRFDLEDLWDSDLSYPERGCASNSNQLGGICTPEVSDPEEAIVAAIEYLIDNNLIKK